MLRLHVLGLLVCSSLFAGCAGQSLKGPDPKAIVVAPTSNETRAIRVVDVRSPERKVERVAAGEKPMTYFGDASFEPSPTKIVEVHLTKGLPEQSTDTVVELTRFDVGLVPYGSHFAGMQASVPQPGVHPGAYVAGNLVGALVVAGLRAASGQGPRSTAYADISIRLNGKEISAVDFVNLDAGFTQEAALARSITNAIQYLCYEIIGRDPNAPSTQ